MRKYKLEKEIILKDLKEFSRDLKEWSEGDDTIHKEDWKRGMKAIEDCILLLEVGK